MNSNYTENGCLILNYTEANLTKVGTAAQQMVPASSQTAVTTLTNGGLMATVTLPTATPPAFFNGQSVAVTLANDAAYNGYFQIFNVVNLAGVTTFNYTMATAPTVAAVQANVSFLKFRMAFVQADPGNGTSITFGPNANGTSRTLIPGQEYQIAQAFGAFGEPVRYEMALWYWKGANGTKLNINYV